LWKHCVAFGLTRFWDVIRLDHRMPQVKMIIAEAHRGSLAIDGDAALINSNLACSPLQTNDSACPPTDQRGVTRPQGLACDIGAFELAPKLTLTRSPDGRVIVQYRFQSGKTHQVFGSSDLARWGLLGTSVSDTNGAFEFEDAEAPNLPRRFYHVQPQTAP
jgi:hypothetical protein